MFLLVHRLAMSLCSNNLEMIVSTSNVITNSIRSFDCIL